MRNLFFALVFANLVFLAVTVWHGDPPQVSAAAVETGVPIRLVGEVDPRSVAPPVPDVTGALAAARDAGSDASALAVTERASAELDRRADATAPGEPADAADRGDRPERIFDRIDLSGPVLPAIGAERPSAPSGSGTAADDAGLSPSLAAAGAAAPGSATASDGPADDAAPANLPTALSSTVAASADDASCVSVGPFRDTEDVGTAVAAIAAGGYPAVPRAAEGEIWIGFWVHIDGIPTRGEANEMLAHLRENGIADAYLIPGEEDGDIISLGVFNTMQRAGRLDEQVRAVGIEPLIVERSRAGTVHWADVTLPRGGELDLDGLDVPRRGGPIEQQPCPQAESATAG